MALAKRGVVGGKGHSGGQFQSDDFDEKRGSWKEQSFPPKTSSPIFEIAILLSVVNRSSNYVCEY